MFEQTLWNDILKYTKSYKTITVSVCIITEQRQDLLGWCNLVDEKMALLPTSLEFSSEHFIKSR